MWLLYSTVLAYCHCTESIALNKLSISHLKPRGIWGIHLVHIITISVSPFGGFIITCAGLSMNGVRSHSHAPIHASIYLGVLSSKTLYYKLIARQCFSKFARLSLRLVSIRKNLLYHKVFGSKHISIGVA